MSNAAAAKWVKVTLPYSASLLSITWDLYASVQLKTEICAQEGSRVLQSLSATLVAAGGYTRLFYDLSRKPVRKPNHRRHKEFS